VADLHVVIYTDPACPYSWAAEPARRRMEVEFGEGLAITYVMVGLAREFSRPVETMRHWIDAAQAGGMPADPRLWLDEPPRSSYPACQAVKAAAEQGLDGPYLRRAREALAFERRALDTADALTAHARTVPRLDVERFGTDLRSSATAEAFAADLERARSAAPERRRGAPRVAIPSIHVTGPAGQAWAYDSFTPDGWHAALVAAGGVPAHERPTVTDALRRFGPMAAVEVAAVCDMPGPTAPAELWALTARWQARVERYPCGEMFSAA
jgi:predicted DsbA family dithiol-disulfide isomerase